MKYIYMNYQTSSLSDPVWIPVIFWNIQQKQQVKWYRQADRDTNDSGLAGGGTGRVSRLKVCAEPRHFALPGSQLLCG